MDGVIFGLPSELWRAIGSLCDIHCAFRCALASRHLQELPRSVRVLALPQEGIDQDRAFLDRILPILKDSLVELDCARFTGPLEPIFSFEYPTLETLKAKLSTEQDLRKMRSLKTLSLADSTWTHLDLLTSLSNLTSLNMPGAVVRNLRQLNFRMLPPVSQEDFEEPQRIRSVFSYSWYSSDGPGLLIEKMAMPYLTWLDISGVNTLYESNYHALGRITTLKTLIFCQVDQFKNSKQKNVTLSSLLSTALKPLVNMEYLNVSGHAGVDDEVFIDSILTVKPKLRWLGVYKCKGVSQELAAQAPSMAPSLEYFVSTWEMFRRGQGSVFLTTRPLPPHKNN